MLRVNKKKTVDDAALTLIGLSGGNTDVPPIGENRISEVERRVKASI